MLMENITSMISSTFPPFREIDTKEKKPPSHWFSETVNLTLTRSMTVSAKLESTLNREAPLHTKMSGFIAESVWLSAKIFLLHHCFHHTLFDVSQS